MKANGDCVLCLLRQAREAVAYAGLNPAAGSKVMREVVCLVRRLDGALSPPAAAQRVHRLIRELAHCADPYAAMKARLNRRASDLHPRWERLYREAFPPLEAAVRLAIIGNLLDAGAKTQLGEQSIETAFRDALSQPLHGAVEELGDAIRRARSILYLADNAGEIVFDRGLLARLPLGNFVVAVRGRPVLNDATLADAEEAGLPMFCDVMDNGSDAPGTLLADCSPEFRERFRAADLVIAKGQGNYESLVGTDKEIFFLLKIKCRVLSQDLGWPVGALVLHHQRSRHSSAPGPGWTRPARLMPPRVES